MIPLEHEIVRLNEAVDAFAHDMKVKLAKKATEGWRGWDCEVNDSIIVSRLITKSNLVEFDRAQAVDIANLAMMLWYLQQPKEGG